MGKRSDQSMARHASGHRTHTDRRAPGALALDILVDEAGYSRAGPNLLLVPGG